MKQTILFLSCEHAVDKIPAAYLKCFKPYESLLTTHRAIDFGAEAIAEHLHKTFACDFTKATVSRLLIDCNRSLGNPKNFSEASNNLSDKEKQEVIEKYYLPYRRECEATIQKHIDKGYQVLHLSIHSFTPVFNNVTRNADIGLLYDPKRHGEKEVAREWHHILRNKYPDFRVRLNYPYQGTSDGFTTALRKKHSEKEYVGIEVESNQAITRDKKRLAELIPVLTDSLGELLQLL